MPAKREPARPKRILIVDDHPLVRRGLQELLMNEDSLEFCGEAADAPSALRLVEETKPDLVVIDIALKEGDGIELVKQIKALDPSILMLVSSMHDESLYGERALRAGAMGYLNKQEPTEKIVEAIHRVLSGRVYLSPRMADRVLHRLVNPAADPDQSPTDMLSDRELAVLGLIGQGLATRQIAEKLHLSVKTIDTHREHIKTKLHLKSANELVRYAVTWSLQKE
jgi:DNA-binding NarL/FixJ family response regulator